MRDHASPLVHNATHVVENNALFEKKRKNLATDFDASGATNGLVGCSYAPFNLLILCSFNLFPKPLFFPLELDYIFLK
jgi:hypothetical protein